MVAFPLVLLEDDNDSAPSMVRANAPSPPSSSAASSSAWGPAGAAAAPRRGMAAGTAAGATAAPARLPGWFGKVGGLLDHIADAILHEFHALQAEFGPTKGGSSNHHRGGGGGGGGVNGWKHGPHFQSSPAAYIAVILAAVNALGYMAAIKWPADIDTAATVCTFGAAYLLATLPTMTAPGVLTRCQTSAALIFFWSVLYGISVDQGVLSTLHVTDAADWIRWVALSFTCLLPHTLGLTSSAAGSLPLLVIGWFVSVSGLTITAVANLQRWGCLQKAEDFSLCRTTGLWSVSQHPDGFGNVLFWTGIFVLNAAALVQQYTTRGVVSTVWGYRRLVLALLCGPCLVATLHVQHALDSAGGSSNNSIPMLVPHPVLLFDTSVYKLPPVIATKIRPLHLAYQEKAAENEVVTLHPENQLDTETPVKINVKAAPPAEDSSFVQFNETDAETLAEKVVRVKRGTTTEPEGLPPPEPATVPMDNNVDLLPTALSTSSETAPDLELPLEDELPDKLAEKVVRVKRGTTTEPEGLEKSPPPEPASVPMDNKIDLSPAALSASTETAPDLALSLEEELPQELGEKVVPVRIGTTTEPEGIEESHVPEPASVPMDENVALSPAALSTISETAPDLALFPEEEHPEEPAFLPVAAAADDAEDAAVVDAAAASMPEVPQPSPDHLDAPPASSLPALLPPREGAAGEEPVLALDHHDDATSTTTTRIRPPRANNHGGSGGQWPTLKITADLLSGNWV